MSDRKEWNHVPDKLPIAVAPIWRWPLNLIEIFRWYVGSWLPVSINLGLVALAFAAYYWASPTLAEAATPGRWIAVIWLRNLIITVLLAHGLHLFFHRYQLQATDKKYDPRPYPRKGRAFDFDDQLVDNIFWTLASGLTVWSAYEVLLWWAMANAYAPTITWSSNPVWFVAIFLMIPIWQSFYFYWIHRLLHTKLLYPMHALHHRNVDVGPWSGLSMHPVEHVLYFGSVLIHFIAPAHPVHVICHLMFYGLYAITTHTGFEGLWVGGRKRVDLGTFHHQIHHRYFEVNYGTLDVPWDKWFGTFHDGTAAAKERMKKRLAERRRV
ncbi:sterol desaturase family protein [Mesorhizobium sp. BH1-1-5]|uniref:sterol desaturase family protein n=1 Tax=unclassified Mesorhizobium TaxID=325217 RepID=UPI00112BB5BF|nr:MULTISPECIES: sterol desaturase family protein [unclassified Mesorhizobium]MBZ9991749.1 sterol desaturase family protein [Mesorhizobium sp. BH1-1-5]TPJ48420.1 sterol desaturase family protein [Mesorhizobium sp. B2-7-1]